MFKSNQQVLFEKSNNLSQVQSGVLPTVEIHVVTNVWGALSVL